MLRRLSLALLVASPVVAQQDDCTNPQPVVANVAIPVDTTGFTTSPTPTCTPTLNAADGWYSWTVTRPGEVIVALVDPSIVVQTLVVYEGVDCSATCLAQANGFFNGVEALGVRVGGLDVGETLLVRVGSSLGVPVLGDLFVIPVPTAIANDDCASPTPITGLGGFPIDLIGSTQSGFDGGSPACTQVVNSAITAPIQDVFLQWTATQAGDVRFRTTAPVGSITIGVHEGTGCRATCLGMNDDRPGTRQWSKTVRNVAVGDTFLVQAGLSFATQTSPQQGTLFVEPAPAAVPGDDCGDPMSIAGIGSFAFDTTGSLVSGFAGGGAPCRPFPSTCLAPSRDVFFAWTALNDGLRRFEIPPGTLSLPRLAVHAGDDCSATCIGFDAPNANDEAASVVVAEVEAGETYLVQVSGSAYWTGTGLLDVSTMPDAIPNDVCSTPTPIVSVDGEAQVAFDTTLATRTWFDGNDSASCPVYSTGDFANAYTRNDLFFVWTPGRVGTFRMSVASGASEPTPRLIAHLGDDCTATCLAENVDPADPDLILTTDPCASYLLQVGSREDDPIAQGWLTIESLGVVPADLWVSCLPASEHEAGGRVTLCNSSLGSGPGGVVHLDPLGGPPGALGFVIVSASEAAPTPVANGLLCLSPSIGRYAAATAQARNAPELDSLGRFDTAGQFVNLAGTAMSTGGSGFDVPASLPFGPPGGTWASGTSLTFQLAYRDGVGSNAAVNFSDAVTIVAP